MSDIAKKLPLSEEENKERLLFIGKCVDQNLALPIVQRIGLTQPLTVQDIVNSNVATLKNIGKQLNKYVGDYDPEFSDSKEPELGGVKITEWVSFLKLVIRKKEFDSQKLDLSRRRDEITKKLAELKTPSELKADLEKELQEMDGVTTP